MGLWNLVSNTVEGVAEVGTNTAKAVVSPFADAATGFESHHTEDAIDGINKGFEKIGKSDKSDDSWF